MTRERTDTRQMDEFTESLCRILKEHPDLPHFRYFVNGILQWYRSIRSGQLDSRVVILGTGIPEELVMAAGEMPFRILGGSHESCLWSDDLVPRDTDPVSRSVLGFLECLEGARENVATKSGFLTENAAAKRSLFRRNAAPWREDLLYIIPVGCDSMRKIAYQLIGEGKHVLAVDIPPVRQDARSQDKWIRQMIRMTETAADQVGGRLSAASMKVAIRTASRARIALHEFSLMAPEYDMILSPAARVLVKNSYYYTRDLAEWTEALRALMQEMKRLSGWKGAGLRTTPAGLQTAGQPGIRTSDRPKVLLLGSPVYFPNDKIPRLLSDAGLRIWREADASEQIQHIIPKAGRLGGNLRKIAETVAMAWYRADASPAYLTNDVMRRKIASLCRTGQIEGVVFHVLKGQIEQDFELAYYEELLEQTGIPVFRLETDYQYQDVEQLRIRMEAFTEMLTQNRCRAAKEAV